MTVGEMMLALAPERVGDHAFAELPLVRVEMPKPMQVGIEDLRRFAWNAKADGAAGKSLSHRAFLRIVNNSELKGLIRGSQTALLDPIVFT